MLYRPVIFDEYIGHFYIKQFVISFAAIMAQVYVSKTANRRPQVPFRVGFSLDFQSTESYYDALS